MNAETSVSNSDDAAPVTSDAPTSIVAGAVDGSDDFSYAFGARVLALCDTPTKYTGFGKVARNILGSWVDAGARVDMWGINFDGWDYDKFPQFRILPAGGRDWFSAQRLGLFLRRLEEGDYTHVWILMDLDALSLTDFPGKLRAACARKGISSMLYFPVDAELEPQWTTIIPAVNHPVCYTRYGAWQVRRAMGKPHYPITVIPHGIDEHFEPFAAAKRKQCRDGLEVTINGEARPFLRDEDFLIVNVNKNEWRKDLLRTLEIVARLKDNLKQSVKLVLRTAPTSMMGGVDIHAAARRLGLAEAIDYLVLSELPEAQMAWLYNAADLYLTTTLGEGWGLGITEALACGTPVAMPLHTSCGEIEKIVRELHPTPGGCYQTAKEHVDSIRSHVDRMGIFSLPCENGWVGWSSGPLRQRVKLREAVQVVANLVVRRPRAEVPRLKENLNWRSIARVMWRTYLPR